MDATPLPRERAFSDRVQLGRTGLSVGRMGLGSSFGLSASDVEHAYHRYGMNYLYWGSLRRPGFGQGVRNLAKSHRDDLVIVLQSYARLATAMSLSVKVGLRRLKMDHADVLLFGLHNQRPAQRLIDCALELKQKGLVRYLAISCHHRPTFQDFIRDGIFDILHVRYNAAHRGAEHEVFPHLLGSASPGIVAFTATRWGTLLKQRAMPAGDRAPDAADCYRFAISHPAVHVVLSGPANRAQLDEGAQALSRGPLHPEEDQWLRRVGQHAHAEYAAQ